MSSVRLAVAPTWENMMGSWFMPAIAPYLGHSTKRSLGLLAYILI
jgi:hypothetical protein